MSLNIDSIHLLSDVRGWKSFIKSGGKKLKRIAFELNKNVFLPSFPFLENMDTTEH